MNLGRFIPNNRKEDKRYNFSNTASTFAIITVAVGIMALIISFSILNGFKKHIREVVYNCNGHDEVGFINGLDGLNSKPISVDSGFYKEYKKFPEIETVLATALKGCIVQNEQTVQGCIIKGYDSLGVDRFNDHLIKGEELKPQNARDVLVSQDLASKLSLDTGDVFVANFFAGKLKYRKLTVKGLFKTNLSEFDQNMIIGNIDLVRKLNKWDDTQTGGFEVVLKPKVDVDEFYNTLRSEIGFDLELIKIKDKYFHLFEWLTILDQNVLVLIVILFVLVLFSIISTMYILIFERNHMVGVLKSIGASNSQILSVFRTWGLKIAVIGMVIGNVLGLGFSLIQQGFKVIPLEAEHYYMDYVPVNLRLDVILSINIISVSVILVMLTVPYLIIVKMRPVENLRFN